MKEVRGEKMVEETVKEVCRKFFERDGNAFLAELQELYPLVAEYTGQSYDSKYLFLWDVWDVQLFKKFKQSIRDNKLITVHTKKDIRGLHQLKIYYTLDGYWLVFETCVRTYQDLKDIYLFYKRW